MIKSKKLDSILFVAVSVLIVYIVALPIKMHQVNAQTALCPGSSRLAKAGEVCSDGSVPIKDDSLPAFCPGSGDQGPVSSDYKVVCPARTGRVECTYTQKDGLCRDANGKTVFDAKKETLSTISGGKGLETECNDVTNKNDKCTLLEYLKNGINFLSAVAVLAITFSLIWAGYQYMTARANAGIVTAAKNRIIMTLVALLLYIFMYAILNWLIPGGLFP